MTNMKTGKINPFFQKMRGESSSYVQAFLQMLGAREGPMRQPPLTAEEINALRCFEKHDKKN